MLKIYINTAEHINIRAVNNGVGQGSVLGALLFL